MACYTRYNALLGTKLQSGYCLIQQGKKAGKVTSSNTPLKNHFHEKMFSKNNVILPADAHDVGISFI